MPQPQAGISIRILQGVLGDDDVARAAARLTEMALGGGKIAVPSVSGAFVRGGVVTVTLDDGTTRSAKASSGIPDAGLAHLSGFSVAAPSEAAAASETEAADVVKKLLTEALFTSLAARSGGLLRVEEQDNALRLTGVVTLGGTPMLLAADLLQDRGSLPLMRDLPLFTVMSKGTARRSGPTALAIETSPEWDNVMAGLSLEDAAAWANIPFTSEGRGPRRSRSLPYSAWGTVPGSSSHIAAASGSASEAGDALALVLEKASEIIARRIDIARAMVAEGHNRELRLLNPQN